MRMLKYLNKRIFVCLCLALIFLVAASFVASSEEGQQECDKKAITFRQNPTGMVTSGTLINFSWNITKEPSTCFEGKPYYLEIKDSNNIRRYYNDTFKIPLEPCSDFTGNDSWPVRDDEPIGSHTSYLKIPGFGGSLIDFEVVETLLVIRKYNDTNQNNEVDIGVDEELRGWEFNVTDPKGKTTKYTTDNNGEIKIEVPPGNYIIEEILKGDWSAITSKKQTKNVLKGNTATVQFLNTPIPSTLLLIQKFNDTNQNGKVDDGVDERLRGWEFNVTDPGGKTSNYTTDGNGEIKIEVPPGNYIIEEILKRGWRAITSKKQTKNVPKGNTAIVQFLNTPQGDLTIIKFYDPNQNGVQDPGDQGLAWNFSIKFPDGSIKRIRTDENGRYRLRNILVGEYEITEEPRGCRWTSSTDMTQKDEVKGGQETIAQFRNYIAECCILPGCVWKNNDENIEVCKSVDPCSVALGKEEEEVTVNLGICVDPKHIINGTKVENISVIDTLHSQFTIVDGSFSEEPKYDPIKNPDGTTTIRWDIPSLCCEEWRVSFNVTVAFALPIDVTDTSERVTSKVIYEDPIETGRRELSIPEGTLKFIVPPQPRPPIWCYLLGGLLVISVVIEITLELKRRKKEKPKEKE